ncbi:GIY-YIG nuclease family protein [Melioribacter sp. OK-6-Me]|uniref:GIY-YIG nuclease family protein n=1 Tax=unclassified Melioribacter TaxID=2627329 RepID=UPI003EDA1D6F
MLKITDAVTNSGIYLLEIFIPNQFIIDIKKFNSQIFPDGYYYYAGSAQKNMRKRLQRHLSKNKTIYWHIDYITCRFDINKIFYFNNRGKDFECKLVSELEEYFGLKSIAPGFGNSDCRICESHLLYSKLPIDYNQFISRYHSIVRFIPSSKETF